MHDSITVVLPVRNGAAFVASAIDSVLAQSFRGVRLLVSDNGSIDETPAVVSAYLSDPRVRMVTRTEGYDMLSHFNKCLDMVETPYYMLLCHDDYLCDPTALEKAYRALEEHPQISTVYCDLEFVDRSGKRIVTRRFGRAGVIPGDRVARSAVIATRNLFGIPLLVRTRALAGARYDRELPYTADVDLSVALACHGSIFHIAEPLIANRYHEGNATLGIFLAALGQMKRIAAKHGIALSLRERLLMRLNAAITVLQKWLFLQYVGKIRKSA